MNSPYCEKLLQPLFNEDEVFMNEHTEAFTGE